MKKDYKYYLSFVLLLLLPLSAVNIDISIHKCKHKDTLHFSLFTSTGCINNSECCCSEKESNQPSNNSSNNLLIDQYAQMNCCSNSEVIYSITNDFLTFDKILFNYVQTSNYELNIFKTPFDHLVNIFPDKNVLYPLKKPINSIISYIHLTSNTNGDDSDVLSYLFS